MNKLILVGNIKALISIQNEMIEIEKNNIKRYQKILQHIYNSCDHKFEEVTSYGANIVRCVNCGYEDGV